MFVDKENAHPNMPHMLQQQRGLTARPIAVSRRQMDDPNQLLPIRQLREITAHPYGNFLPSFLSGDVRRTTFSSVVANDNNNHFVTTALSAPLAISTSPVASGALVFNLCL